MTLSYSQTREYHRRYSQLCQEADQIIIMDFLGGKCSTCSISDKRVLQFDHISPIKRKHNNSSWGRRTGSNLVSAILKGDEDLSNIQLLCANCHMRKTYWERTNT